MLNILRDFLKGHERTVRAKKNIIASFFIKGLSIVVSFLIVRITLDYLDQTKYGVWLTISSFLVWFNFFEIGLGSGLKNKLAESLALKDYKMGKVYVSTTYAILSIVIGLIAIIFFIGNIYIDWAVVLNTDVKLGPQLTNLAFIVFGFFFLRFIVKLINIVLAADQQTAMSNLFSPIGNLISLIVIYILTKTTSGSLIYIGFVFSVVPVIVLIVATFYFYNTKYKRIAPSYKYINFNYAKDLLNLGVQFFFIQIAGLIIYQSSNIIIAQFFGPSEVTTYNIAYKYFSIITMLFGIIIAPFWPAYTEAWTKNDIKWIKNIVNKLLKVWIGMVVLGFFMLIFADKFYYLWIGDKVVIPFTLSLALFIYFVTYTFGGIYVMFINGVGKVKIQMYSSFLGAIIFIVSSIIMIKYLDWGIKSILFAMIFSNFNGIFLAPIQYKKLINKTAKGIWNK